MAFDCTDIKATLSGLIDDQVDADTRHLAERHLSECAACRGLVSEAEGLDELIAMDAAELAPRRLSDGFVDGVLNRTVYARMYEQAGWSWTNWLGWVAAAASLCLAASIWFLDRQARPSSTDRSLTAHSDAGAAPTRGMNAADASGLRSWTYDDGLEPGAIIRTASIDSEFDLDDATRLAIDEQLALAQPARALERVAQSPAITPEDSDTLHATALLLDMVADSDLTDFADIERVREIASYDQLPQRLADVRSRLRPADRAAVMAAESILLRIVNGPMDLGDLRLLHDTVASLNLAAQIGAISGGRDAATSM